MSVFRSKPFVCLLGLLLLAGVAAAVFWPRGPRRPNVLLITLDTTRADRLGCYGHAEARTPTLDEIASSGAMFRRAYAPAPLTLPSHTTMMTGLYPPEHGVRTNGKGRLHAEVPTLAETLKASGYRTGAFVGAFVLDSKFGLDQGFDKYDDDLSQSRRTEDPLHRERPGNAVVDRALAWLGADADEPFCCWVHLYDPHFPYLPHQEVFDTEFEQRPYDGEIAFVDRQIARLQDHLKENGLDEDTLVIVVGDHGEGLGEHQEAMHGYMLYNSTLHVPWLMAWPGRLAPKIEVDNAVSLVDLLPTCLELLEVPAPEGVTGLSLAGAFRGEPISPSACYAETDDPRLDNGWCGLQTLITPEWKYIRTARSELFRMPDDATEQHDIATAETERVAALERGLLDFLAGLTPRKTDLAALSQREVRVLSSLGYTAGQSTAEPLGDLSGHDVKDMVVHFNRVVEATHLLEEGRAEEAEPLLRATVEAVPDYIIAWGSLGRALSKLQRLDEARECYRRVLEMDADNTSALLNLATADLAEHRPQEAEVHLQKVLEIDPQSAEAYYYLAGAKMESRDRPAATALLTRALAIDPEHVASLTQLGDLHFDQGEFSNAIEYYTAANRFDPYAVGPYVNRGIALGQLQRLDEAIACFESGLKLLPESPLLHSNLGFALEQMRQYGEAIEHYEAALSQFPGEPQAITRLPKLLAAVPNDALRNGGRALELAQRAVELSEGASWEAHDALAAALAELGRFEEAVQAIAEARRKNQLTQDDERQLLHCEKLYRAKRPLRLAPAVER